MNIKDRVIKAKTDLMGNKDNTGHPFFAYLLLHLNDGNEIEQREDIPTAMITSQGHMSYNPKWLDKLNDNQIKAVMLHEVLHVVLNHMLRMGTREPTISNIADDIVINNMLVQNGFELVHGKGYIEPYNNSVTLLDGQIKIDNIDEKFSESIYEELYHQMQQKGMIKEVLVSGYGTGKPNEDSKVKGFDAHEKGNADTKEAREAEKKWGDVLVEAANQAKLRGKLPAGMDRIIDKILNKKLNWRNLLYKYITEAILYDYSWNKLSRKAVSTGIWLPGPLKESIEVVVAVDTSGSIGQKELTDFLSEIVSIAKSFNNIEITVVVCDCEIKNTYVVRNGEIAKIMALKVRGGGGTSHEPVVSFINKSKPNSKVLVMLTDGYSDLEICLPKLIGKCDPIVCLTENGAASDTLKKLAKVIKMEE